MNRYLKLVHYELHRFRKIYLALLLMTLISQFVGLYFFIQNYISHANDTMMEEALSRAGFIAKYGIVYFRQFSNESMWFMTPIALCAAALLLYVFLIWYRDWFSKNMFIYRLLMLPTSRNTIFYAKISVILLLILGLVSFQMLILPLENVLFNSLIPSDLSYASAVTEIIANHPLLQILIPRSFIEFVLYYGAGVIGVILVFTAILLERCYRLKGFLGGIIYCGAACFVFLLPELIAAGWFENYLYPPEQLILEAVLGILIACASLWFSSFLLNKKVTV